MAVATETVVKCPYCGHAPAPSLAVAGRAVVMWQCRNGRCQKVVRVVIDSPR